MGTTRLDLYNDALLNVGERFLSSLTEEREPRRLLDHVWNNEGVNACLEEAQWHFAIRTIRIDYDPAITPEFGYQYGFTVPSDWVLTSAVCTDEYFNQPLTRYQFEQDYWFSDEQIIYVRYVSNDASYGGNLAAWPKSFTRFVAAHFAYEIAYKIGGDALQTKMFGLREKMLSDAKNRSAMALPTSFPARGSWSRARHGSGRNDDRGNNGSLIG